MTEQNPFKKAPWLTFRDIFWFAVVVALIILMMKQCGGHAAAYSDLKKKADSLSISEANARIKEAENKIRFDDSLRNIKGQLELAQIEKKETESNLSRAEQRINKLIADHEIIPISKGDSGYYVVPDAYVKNCEECIVELESGKKEVKKYITQSDSIEKLRSDEIRLLNNRLEFVKNELSATGLRYDALNATIGKLLKIAKPKTSIAGGIEGTYSPVNTQIGIWLEVNSKGNKVYGIGYGINSLGSYYASGRIGVNIIGKK